MEKSILLSEIQRVETTSLTPIEIVLGVDEDGRTTAKKLYNFLELDLSNYSRWCKNKITENEFASENIDYERLVINDERNPNPTQDFKLSASFAKKLAMGTHNFKGEAAKNYFVKVEEKLKDKPIKQLTPLAQLRLQYQVIEQHEEKLSSIETKVNKLENSMTIDYAQQEKLSRLAREKVVRVLGGKGTPAYKKLNKKVFSEFWRDYKRVMGVNSYKNTAVKDIDRAILVIDGWKPSDETCYMILGVNSQLGYEEVI